MFTLNAPAKINWFLRVMGKRKDGYHDIESLLQCISLYDVLTLEKSDALELITDAPIPTEQNIVYKAAIALKDAAGISNGARITLEKRIPLEAGMGGGSSDAACTLMGLKKLWGLDIPERGLFSIAERLGSDVPFFLNYFLNGPSAVVSGRGERAQPVSIRKSCVILLLKPPVGVSAQWAYSGLSSFGKPEIDIEAIIKTINEGDYAALGGMLKNDLEGPVIGRYREIGELKRKAIENGALFSLMSGSGSTVFSLFEDAGKAEEAGKTIGAHWWAVVRTIV